MTFCLIHVTPPESLAAADLQRRGVGWNCVGWLCGLENVTKTSVSLTQPPPRPPRPCALPPHLLHSALDQPPSLLNPHVLSMDILDFYTLNVQM